MAPRPIDNDDWPACRKRLRLIRETPVSAPERVAQDATTITNSWAMEGLVGKGRRRTHHGARWRRAIWAGEVDEPGVDLQINTEDSDHIDRRSNRRSPAHR